MPETKTNKERVNITVDPHIHRAFSATAERQGLTVSGILNTMMAIYVGDSDLIPDDNPVSKRLRRSLGGDSSTIEFRTSAGRLVENAGFKPLDLDETDSANIREIPRNMVDEWIGDIGKQRVGIKVVAGVNRQADLVLGQALMLRARSHCDVVHIAVPYITGIDENVLKTIKQAGLNIVSIDGLVDAIGKNRKAAAKREENRKRLSDAESELQKMQNKRKSRSEKPKKASNKKEPAK